jgi:hypothetical protein
MARAPGVQAVGVPGSGAREGRESRTGDEGLESKLPAGGPRNFPQGPRRADPKTNVTTRARCDAHPERIAYNVRNVEKLARDSGSGVRA